MDENDRIYYVTIDEPVNEEAAVIKEVPESQATYVCISTHEYHGLCKALRIVHDRALQQIDKSKTDAHGYLLMRAERRLYPGTGYPAWLITKRTPYSCRMAIADIEEIVSRDLHEFYHCAVSMSGLSTMDLIDSDSENGYHAAEIARLSVNFSTGVYEVTYWSNKLV